jgi:thiamine-phosphate pyrophosphorylase
MSFKLPEGIYGITAEKFSCGRSNIEVVEAMIRGGVRVVQYREKHKEKSIREMFEECLAIREITRKNGVLFIVNDFVDIALLSDADGVHVGQDDLPISEVRRLVGHRIVGVSTHSPEQAKKAVDDGADYIGVGPIFETQTKDDVCAPVGFSYLEHVAANVPIPFVAIGGIKAHNIHEVTSRGAKTVCMVTEIVGAEDIEETARKLGEKLYAMQTKTINVTT